MLTFFEFFSSLAAPVGKMKLAGLKIILLLSVCLGSSFAPTGKLAAQKGGIKDDSQNKSFIGTQATPTSQPFAANQFFDLTGQMNGAHLMKTLATVSLEINEESPLIIRDIPDFNCRVQIDYGPDNTNTQQVVHTFTVSFKKAEGQKSKVKNYFSFNMDGTSYVKLTLLDNPPAASNGFDPKDVLAIHAKMAITRWYNMPANTAAPQVSNCSDASVNSDELAIFWAPAGSVPNNGYQLEWAWVETGNDGEYGGTGTANFYDRLFNSNATRIDIPARDALLASSFPSTCVPAAGSFRYNIPLYYNGNGILYYRVRAVNFEEGGRVDGDWSAPGSFSFGGHQANLNWQVRTSFAEEGKRKSVMEYYDGGLRSRQTLTKDNETGKVIAAETFYDLQGRAAIQVLPAPLLGASSINTVIGYQQHLNKFNGQGNSEAPTNFFDLVDAADPAFAGYQTPPLDNTSGTAQYYSANNTSSSRTTQYIPDAEGFPYTVTRYSPDGTGRIIRQSGVGSSYNMGSGHETRYYYGTPAQEELDALFGTDVGNSTHYFKNMVVDANGQTSVSYVDMHGRTIATAFAGDNPAALAPLNRNNAADYPNKGDNQLQRNLLDANTNLVKNNSTIESVSSLLVPVDGFYDFTYEISPDLLQLKNCQDQDICFRPIYNLEIAIVNEDPEFAGSGAAAPVMVWKYTNLPATTLDATCSTGTLVFRSLSDQDVTFTNTLHLDGIKLLLGSYSVRKTLVMDPASFETYRKLYLENKVCTTLQELTNTINSTMDCTSKVTAATCQSCNDGLLVYKAEYYVALGTTEAAAPEAIKREVGLAIAHAAAKCDQLCNPPSRANITKRELMLRDMMPFTGQYAQELPVSTAVAKYNIFSTTALAGDPGPRPFFRYPLASLSNYGVATYHNQFGETDNPVNLAGIDPVSFSSIFKNEWALALLPYHPEYNRLLLAESPQMAGIYTWGNTMQQMKYADASSNGYISATGLVNSDPFYALAGNASRKTIVEGYLATDYRAQGINMWQMAYSMAKLQNVFDEQSRLSLAGSFTTADLATMSDDDKEAIWKQLSLLYISERNQQIDDYIAVTVPLSYDADLISAGRILHFPKSNKQWATQHLSDDISDWYPDVLSDGPKNGDLQEVQTENYQSNCEGYIAMWRSSLLQCPALVPAIRDQVITDITDGMLTVCKLGTNAANPGGASTVPLSTPASITDRSFEDVIARVFQQYNIQWTDLCNPYVIEAPRPMDLNRPASKEMIQVVDVCACDQLATIKTEAATALGITAPTYEQFNGYVLATYGEGIAEALFAAMEQNCASLRQVCDQEPDCTPQSLGEGYLFTYDFETASSGTTYNHPYTEPAALNMAVFSNSSWSNSYNPATWTTFNGVNNSGRALALPATSQAEAAITLHLDVDSAYKVMVDGFSFYNRSSMTGYRYWGMSINQQDVDLGSDTLLYVDPDNSHYVQLLAGTFTALGPFTGPVDVVLKLKNASGTGGTFRFDDFKLHGSVVPVDCEGYSPAARMSSVALATGSSPCVDSNYAYVLSKPEILPSFLKCGFVGRKNCYTCDELRTLVTTFKTKFIATYNAGPIITTGQALTAEEVMQNQLFARYLNFKTGMSYTWADYLKAAASNSCLLDPTQATSNGAATVICRNNNPTNEQPNLVAKPDRCKANYLQALNTATVLYEALVKDANTSFERSYSEKCLAPITENFTVAYTNSEYHYTLYYYDQAGNLVRTVSPKGVAPDFSASFLGLVKTARANSSTKTPVHTYDTRYQYNSLNQVVRQRTPDAGLSRFYYDLLGRLVMSQNQQQAIVSNGYHKFSYTLYDKLGRIWEVGEKAIASSQPVTTDITKDPAALKALLTSDQSAHPRGQITRTVYDQAKDFGSTPIPAGYAQKNLRSRVSYSQVINVDNASLVDLDVPLQTLAGVNGFQSATYYSYDVHGNVDKLLQHHNEGPLKMVAAGAYQFKLLEYEYDLISGKVNRVIYQRGQKDAYYHQYGYDAENRLVNVYSGADEFILEQEREAHYEYYEHGPLARVVLGQQQVQGVDYAYTIQGWLKGVNSTNLLPQSDMGQDGISQSAVARDIVGFGLHYFDNGSPSIDYKPIQAVSAFAGAAGIAGFNSLYNGNIAGMSVNNLGLKKGPRSTKSDPLFYRYQYDQLNRLVAMQAFENFQAATNSWASATITDDYKEHVTYDPNGNILEYTRNGTANVALAMDDMDYTYWQGTNRLKHVGDNAPENYDEDYHSVSGNYEYDEIGNIVKDPSAGIDKISWTVYGKIASIEKTDDTDIFYTYDAAGNRVSKRLSRVNNGTTHNAVTTYVRDAQGNVMAVYSTEYDNTNESSGSLVLKEQHLYGSSRLGMGQPELNMLVSGNEGDESLNINGAAIVGRNITFARGNKLFELSNHLGNVLAVVTDRKLQVAQPANLTHVDYYQPELASAWDYYPFGMQMPNRTVTKPVTRNKGVAIAGITTINGHPVPVKLAIFTRENAADLTRYTASESIVFEEGFESVGESDAFVGEIVEPGYDGDALQGVAITEEGGYRYGFNGKENDNEVKGTGNQQDYGMRIYDPRLGRFLSVDPLTKSYPELTPYQFGSNSPILNIDIDGLEGENSHEYDEDRQTTWFKLPTAWQVNNTPGHAVLLAAGYYIWEFTGRPVEDFIKQRKAGKNSAGEIVLGTVELGIASADFKGGHVAGFELHGGRFKDLTSSKGARHELIANQALKDAGIGRQADNAAITTPPEIHYKTGNFGFKGKLFRLEQAELLKAGKFQEAFDKGINDIKEVYNKNTKLFESFGFTKEVFDKAISDATEAFKKSLPELEKQFKEANVKQQKQNEGQ